jgi:hypothetical protein
MMSIFYIWVIMIRLFSLTGGQIILWNDVCNCVCVSWVLWAFLWLSFWIQTSKFDLFILCMISCNRDEIINPCKWYMAWYSPTWRGGGGEGTLKKAPRTVVESPHLRFITIWGGVTVSDAIKGQGSVSGTGIFLCWHVQADFRNTN